MDYICLIVYFFKQWYAQFSLLPNITTLVYRNVLRFIRKQIVIFILYSTRKRLHSKSKILTNSIELPGKSIVLSKCQLSQSCRCIHKVTSYLGASSVAHNLSIVKGDSFSDLSQPALRIFVWFRQPNFGLLLPKSKRFDLSSIYFCIGAKPVDRCNLACLEMSGYVFLRCKSVS